MNELEDLTTLVRAATPLLVIETVDEQRVIECFRHVIAQSLRPLWRWTLTEGLSRLDFAASGDKVAPDATATLEAMRAQGPAGIFLMFDFHPFLRYAMSLRMLRELVQREHSAAHTIVLVGAKVELPEELEALALRVPLALPDIKELAGIMRGEAAAWQREQGRRVEVDSDAARTIVRNLLGLSAPDARRIVRKLIYNDGALGAADLPELMQSKFDLLNRSGLLHFEYATASFADIAGVSRVREWVQRRRAVFLDPSATPMLDPPKGVLLLGVQGCGKSLAAKAIAGGFGVPLVRLDFGTLYNLEIFALHLKRRQLDPAGFDLPALALAAEGFSGAEIEQTIVSALYDAAGSGAPPDQAALLHALQQTRPLSVLMREQVDALRAWAQGRCVAAD